MIDILRKNPSYELELRIGIFENGKFQSGINYELFLEIYKDLMTCESIEKSEPWSEVMDVFFNLNGEEYRTRVSYPNDTMKISSETIIKKKKKQCHVELEDKYNFRVSVSEEKIVFNEKVPYIVNPTYVRLKHTKTFYITNESNIKYWRIDLGKTWGAATRTEVEEKQHSESPTYEVECELMNAENYLRKKTDEETLKSIITKGLSILGVPECPYKTFY